MALHNPSQLYTGGLTKLDYTPYANTLLRYRAQRAAKEEALDKYFGELPKTLNSAGLRDEDIEGVNKRVDGLKQYYLQNKDAIRKGGAARYNYEKAIRETSGYIDSGKNKAKNLLELGKKRFEKGNEYIFADPQMTEKIHKWSLSLDHPEYEPFDPATTTLPVRPYDKAGHQKEMALLKPDKFSITTEVDKDDPLKDLVTTTPVFSADQLSQLRTLSLHRYHNNPSYENEIGKVMEYPDEKENLSKIYKKYYGTEPTEPEEFATAYDLSTLMPAPEKVTRVANATRTNQAKNAEWDRRNAIGFKQSMAKIHANKTTGVDTDTPYLTDIVADESGEDVEVKFGGNQTSRRVIYIDKVDPIRMDIITGKDLSKKLPGVKPIPIKDGVTGKVRLGYYQDIGTGDWEGKDGQKISRERVRQTVIEKKENTKFKAQSAGHQKGFTSPTKKGKYD